MFPTVLESSGKLFYSGCNLLARGLRSDGLILWFIDRVYFTGWPQARRMLRHYLDGTGMPQAIDVAGFIRADAGIRAVLAQAVEHADRGRIAIPQWQFACRDWRYALGSVRLFWLRSGNEVKVEVQTRYDWHPGEARVTRRIHEAATRMKKHGAAAFEIRACSRMSLEEIQAARSWIPRDRAYL